MTLAVAGQLISFDEALAQVAASAVMLGHETIPLRKAAGRVLAAPLHARYAFPRHATAMRDGYAVRAVDVAAETSLTVIGEAHAGGAGLGSIAAGQAMRIFTGAAVPEGSDCIIMQEYAEVAQGKVRFRSGHGPSRHIRAAGSDFSAGQLLLDAGCRLTAGALVTAAAADVEAVPVAMPPRLAIIATGDELVPPGAAHRAERTIPDSVTPGVAAMAEEAGAQVTAAVLAGDDLSLLQHHAADAIANAHIVVVTGGASVGARDFGRAMFVPLGLELYFAGVAMMPGRPVWFGRSGKALVLGLPGNPTSAMVTARLLLVPLIAAMQGLSYPAPLTWRRLPLAGAIGPNGEREAFLRASWEEAGLRPAANQDSGMQSVLASSDWLIRRRPGAPAAGIGEMVSALAF